MTIELVYVYDHGLTMPKRDTMNVYTNARMHHSETG